MKPIFKSLYLGIVLWRMCLSAQAALSHELITPTSSSPSFEQQMAETMRKMDQDMVAAPLTGDPNHDFSAMMIPHHQGAIDMAKTFLLHGQDAALRRLAQEIIVTQQQEIQVMRLRLAALQSPATTAQHDKRQEISASILVSEKDRVYTGEQITWRHSSRRSSSWRTQSTLPWAVARSWHRLFTRSPNNRGCLHRF